MRFYFHISSTIGGYNHVCMFIFKYRQIGGMTLIYYYDYDNNDDGPTPHGYTACKCVCVWYTSDSPISLCSMEKLCECCGHGVLLYGVYPNLLRYIDSAVNVHVFGLDFAFRGSRNSQLFLFFSFGQNSKSIDMTISMLSCLPWQHLGCWSPREAKDDPESQ